VHTVHVLYVDRDVHEATFGDKAKAWDVVELVGDPIALLVGENDDLIHGVAAQLP
jgi:hypothetical protein